MCSHSLPHLLTHPLTHSQNGRRHGKGRYILPHGETRDRQWNQDVEQSIAADMGTLYKMVGLVVNHARQLESTAGVPSSSLPTAPQDCVFTDMLLKN